MNDCVFCKIVTGEAPATILYADEQVTAFYDIHPITPVHILVVPNRHFESLNEVGEEDAALLGHLIVVAKQLAFDYGLDQRGYRLVINTGPEAGQSVFHLHLHLIGGRRMPFRFQ
ncbi:MAG: histidine triad nucleotide-binding protein [Chloroflexota bacterium]